MTELHSVLYAFYPTLMKTRVDIFLISDPMQIYFNKDGSPEGIPGLELRWYIKFMCDDLFLASAFFCSAMIAFRVSVAVFFLFAILFLYQMIDIFLFMYNYKKSAGTYWIILAVILSGAFTILKKNKIYEYESKYKSMI